MYKKLIFLISFVLILGLAGNVLGGTVKWDNGAWVDNLWRTAENWDGDTLPTSDDDVEIGLANPSGSLIDDDTTALTRKLNVGTDDGPGDLRMTGGTLDTSHDFHVGDKDAGEFRLEGGTVTVGNSAKKFEVGEDAVGTFIMSAGSLTVTHDFTIADDTDSGGSSMTLTGGTVTANKKFKVGDKAVGTLTMSDGSITLTGTEDMYIADQDGSSGSVMTMTGGTITIGTLGDGKSELKVGDEARGTLNMSGGSITIGDDLIIADNEDSGGSSVTLTGGTITVGKKVKVADKKGEDAAITIDGGTLTAGDYMKVGNKAAGTFLMEDGTVTLAGKLVVGDSSDSDGSSMTMKAGSITTGGSFKVGNKSSASFDMQGGTIAIGPDVGEGKDKAVTIGDESGGAGTMIMSDGYIDISGGLNIGDDGATGDLTMSGGTIDVGPGIGDDPTKSMNIGRDTGTGTVTMSGGTINISDSLNVGKTPEGDSPGIGTLTMTSGLIVADANINIGLDGSTGNVFLSGDAVLMGDALFIGASSNFLDMAGPETAMLILAGDDLAEVIAFINAGLITVNGFVVTDEWPGWKMDFNIRNIGMTTVTVPEPATIALLGLGGLVLLRRKRR